MTRGEAINDRARKGAAYVQAEQAYDRTVSAQRDPKARYLAGIALANAKHAFEQAQRVEREFAINPPYESVQSQRRGSNG